MKQCEITPKPPTPSGPVPTGDLVVEDKSDVFMNGHDVEVLTLDHKKRKGWSTDAFVFNPERSNEPSPKLGYLHWRLPGLKVIVR